MPKIVALLLKAGDPR